MAEKKSYFDEPSDFTAEDEIILHEAQFDETTTSRGGTMVLRCSLAVGLFVVFAVVALLTQLPLLALVGLVAAGLLFSCTHVILEWERAVVLRGGKFHRVAGPGLFFMVPLLDSVTATVDTRMRSTAFKAEHVLTADLVPVDVDAGIFCAILDSE